MFSDSWEAFQEGREILPLFRDSWTKKSFKVENAMLIKR